MDRWSETDRYQALVGACRTMDHAEQARIIDAALQEGAARIARAEGT